MSPMGIVWMGRSHKFGYGWKHGFGVAFRRWQWLPDWAQRAFVHSANTALCFFLGHDEILRALKDEGVEQVCCACSRPLKSDDGDLW